MLKPKFHGLSFRPALGRCPICGDASARATCREADLTVFTCRGCGTAYVDPQPDAASIAGLYADDYFSTIYDPQSAACTAYFQGVMTRISRVRPTGRLLEVGPGRGYFLQVSRDAGWDVAGVELSGAAAGQLRNRGFDVAQGTLDDLPAPDRRFDMVVMWDVLEHVPDPVAALRHVPRLLGPGGLFVLKVPNRAGLRPWLNRALTGSALGWVGRRLGMTNYYVDHGFHHLFHFTRGGIRLALGRAGLRAERVVDVDEPAFAHGDNVIKRVARVSVEWAATLAAAREALLVFARPIECADVTSAASAVRDAAIAGRSPAAV